MIGVNLVKRVKMRVKHSVRLALSLVDYAIVNRSLGLLLFVLLILVGGLLVTAGQVALPYIYTIF